MTQQLTQHLKTMEMLGYTHDISLNSIAIFSIFFLFEIKYQMENNERIQGITSSV